MRARSVYYRHGSTRSKSNLYSVGRVRDDQILSQCAKKKGVSYKIQRRDAISIAGMAKLYVRDLITKGGCVPCV